MKSTAEEQSPLIPHPDSLNLSDDEIRRLQQILNAADGKQFNEVEAMRRGLELLQLGFMLLDAPG